MTDEQMEIAKQVCFKAVAHYRDGIEKLLREFAEYPKTQTMSGREALLLAADAVSKG